MNERYLICGRDCRSMIEAAIVPLFGLIASRLRRSSHLDRAISTKAGVAFKYAEEVDGVGGHDEVAQNDECAPVAALDELLALDRVVFGPLGANERDTRSHCGKDQQSQRDGPERHQQELNVVVVVWTEALAAHRHKVERLQPAGERLERLWPRYVDAPCHRADDLIELASDLHPSLEPKQQAYCGSDQHDNRCKDAPGHERVAAYDALLPKAPVVIYLAGRAEWACVARAAIAVRVGTGRVTRATHAARGAHAGADHRGVECGSPCPGSQVKCLKRDAWRLAARRELKVATRGAKALGVLVLAGRADDEHRHRCAHGLAVERELKREAA
eukprot:scaffold39258_cov67-Phaeocystis_antarctica.AAC.5